MLDVRRLELLSFIWGPLFAHHKIFHAVFGYKYTKNPHFLRFLSGFVLGETLPGESARTCATGGMEWCLWPRVGEMSQKDISGSSRSFRRAALPGIFPGFLVQKFQSEITICSPKYTFQVFGISSCVFFFFFIGLFHSRVLTVLERTIITRRCRRLQFLFSTHTTLIVDSQT